MLRTLPANQSVLSVCGLAVHKLGLELAQTLESMHMALYSVNERVDKAIKNTQRFTQLSQFMYTVFEQFYNTFKPVNLSVVHIIHIAYKKEYYFKKEKLNKKGLTR